MSRAGQPSFFKMPIKSVTGVERDKKYKQDTAERAESISLKPKISDSQLPVI